VPFNLPELFTKMGILRQDMKMRDYEPIF